MNDTGNNSEKELARIYHDLEGLHNLTECLEEKTDDEKLHIYFSRIKGLLSRSQSYIIERVVRDVMGAYRKEDRTDDCSSPPISCPRIRLLEAEALSRLIEEEAKRLGMRIVTAIADNSTNPVSVRCMEDSYIASYDIAVNKAYTSAALKMSTSRLKELAAPGQELYGIQHTNQGKIVIIGGGEPLIYEGMIIGALGVSGGTEAEDTYLAEFGKNKLREVIQW